LATCPQDAGSWTLLKSTPDDRAKAAYWNADAVKKGHLAPQLKIKNEKEKPQTVNYDELVKSWSK
jgi:hypothetical protein